MRKLVLSLKLLALILLGLSHAQALPGESIGRRKLGLEIEYSLHPNQKKKLDQNRQAAELLAAVRQVTSSQTAVRIRPWKKYASTTALFQAEVIDGQGRIWRSVPEQVDSSDYDGRELITPPLTTEQDLNDLGLIRQEIESSQIYQPGIRSSIHLNYDVSDLITAEGDAKRLVNVILFIEQHWREIYRVIKPSRYGTIVNQFAVPLSANQPTLLVQLANLAPNKRTYENVRGLFLDFYKRELSLNYGMTTHAWKFRAANYGKILELFNPNSKINRIEVPIIEFRISDFVDMKRLREIDRLLTSIINYAAQQRPITQFTPTLLNFGSVSTDEDTDFSELNNQIRLLPYNQLETFLREIGFRSDCSSWLEPSASLQ